jgi:hypothetical protein
MERAGWNYPSGDLRVSDADRDRALSELSEAFQAGRITADELDQRSEHALRARTGNELTALLGDLPVSNVPATPTPAPGRTQRIAATRVGFAAAVAAICFAAVAAGHALSTGPTIQQRQLLRGLAARQGMPVPHFPPSPGFDWAGTFTPGVIAVLLVVLVVCLRVRVARADRR